jgi:ADP-heptose:LPS heptosyltransferase
LASTSPDVIAQELLDRCLAGEKPPVSLIHKLVDADSSDALFRIVVEGLADRFEPRLCDAYADIFSVILESVPLQRAPLERVMPPPLSGLRDRYERVRRPRVCSINPQRVYVLSRVTLGADIAITSVILDAAKQRFPHSEIYLAGSAKAAELFAADERIRHFPVSYPRSGSMRERLATWTKFDDGIVIDPDSRLSQLGLLPVCAEDDYLFFESRAYGGDSDANLTALTQRWVRETFGVSGNPYIAPLPVAAGAQIAVSFGVGENLAKRVDDAFEADLLRQLAARADSVIVDRGAGGDEAERVERAIASSGARNITTWNGSFAGFASIIANARFYAGYDSAGQHAAAASGTPQLTIFRGYVSERMFQRWRPVGKDTHVLKDFDPEVLLRILPKIR